MNKYAKYDENYPVIIDTVTINKIYGDRNLFWDLNAKINILIGKNGSGKSTVLQLIDAYK